MALNRTTLFHPHPISLKGGASERRIRRRRPDFGSSSGKFPSQPCQKRAGMALEACHQLLWKPASWIAVAVGSHPQKKPG